MAARAPDHNEMKLEIHYQGPAVDAGRMTARDLGPAIFSVAQAVERTARILYGDQGRLQVEVDADFEHASFGLEFYLVSAGGELIQSLSLDDLASIATILGFAGGAAVVTVKSVFGLMRWVRGRKIDTVEQLEDGDVRLTIRDESVTVNFNVYATYADPHVRRGIGGLVEPLQKAGIDRLSIQPEGMAPEQITREEAASFIRAPGPEEEISDSVSEQIVEVVAPTFQRGNKWRFSQGNVTFFADVIDEDFLDRVDRHDVVFGKGDALRIDLEVRTRRVAGEYEYDRSVVRVVEHIRAKQSEQLELPARAREAEELEE